MGTQEQNETGLSGFGTSSIKSRRSDQNGHPEDSLFVNKYYARKNDVLVSTFSLTRYHSTHTPALFGRNSLHQDATYPRVPSAQLPSPIEGNVSISPFVEVSVCLKMPE